MVDSLLKPLLLLAVSCCSGLALADAGVTVKTDKKASVLGEPVQVEVRVQDAREPLDSIPLDRWKQDFNVYAISSSRQTRNIKGRSVSSETMTLTLYPLRSGRLHLSPLQYRGASSKAVELRIAESGKNAARVIMKTAVDIQRLSVRQGATLRLDIYDDGSQQWSAPRELVAGGAHLRKLAETQLEEEMEGSRYTVHRYAWALMPLHEGSLTIEFPMLDAMKFGTRLRYAVAPLRLEVAPVPAYLPVHVPIGQIQVEAEPLPPEIALDRPVNRVFTVQGAGLSEEGLGKLLADMRGNDSVRFYPFKIANGDNGRPVSALQTFQVTLPFVPLRTGLVQLAEISIPYYDPLTSRIHAVIVPVAQVQVYSPLWRTGGLLAAVLLALAGAAGAGYWLAGRVQRRRRKRAALHRIYGAASAQELQQALMAFNNGQTMPHCHTLQQWLQALQQRYEVDERLFVVAGKLEDICYGGAAGDIAVLAREASRLLEKMPVKRSVAGKSQLVPVTKK